MSAIEWTEKTWNPVTGCDRVAPGCAHCYALDLAARLKGMGQARYQRDGDPRTSGPGFGVTLHRDKLDEPLRRRKPTMYFVNSMSDLFHEAIPTSFLLNVFATMAAAPQHTFQVLTKRAERMARLVPWVYSRLARWDIGPEPLPNVWLGVSIENRRFIDRAAVLGEIPAAVRFVSAEPLLGPLICESESFEASAPTAAALEASRVYRWRDDYTGPQLPFYNRDGELAFHWLIAGGESGPRHRAVRPEWVRDLRDVCQHEGVAFFFKQWGGRTPKSGGRELDGRTWDEMPEPAAVAA